MRAALPAFLSFAGQVVLIHGSALGLTVPRWLLAPGLAFTYLVLMAVVVANLRSWGILVLGVGALLNFTAMSLHGGLMPVTPETLDRAGLAHLVTNIGFGQPIPGTKDVLLDHSSVKLYPITDILVLGFPTQKVYSPGDMLIGVGALLALAPIAFGAIGDIGKRNKSFTPEVRDP